MIKTRALVKLVPLFFAFTLAPSCSKKEDVTESITLDGGSYPGDDALGMWESITKNNCTDKAKAKYSDGKSFQLMTFETVPNPPRKSADGKKSEYDQVNCTVKVSF